MPGENQQSRHGTHNRDQTAFRLPPELKAWLESRAEATGRTMTDIVITALEAERERTATSAS